MACFTPVIRSKFADFAYNDIGMRMKGVRFVLGAAFLLLLVRSLLGQDTNQVRLRAEAQWSKKTSVPAETVHRLWRSISHFADERDDDSQIVDFDTKSLASRGQLLMVTAAGLPTCLTVTVFSNPPEYRVAWSESESSDGHRFCEELGIEPEVNVKGGTILIKAPVGLISRHSSDVEVVEYTYTWTGGTYFLGRTTTSRQFVASARPE